MHFLHQSFCQQLSQFSYFKISPKNTAPFFVDLKPLIFSSRLRMSDINLEPKINEIVIRNFFVVINEGTHSRIQSFSF